MTKRKAKPTQPITLLEPVLLKQVVGGTEITSPRDASSGLATGKRSHHP